MQEARYMISDAAKKLDVEPHVLRYWEEELELDIPRNEMGHRFYREVDIDNFFTIRRLKEHGFHLRAIKMLLPDLKKIASLDKEQLKDLRYELESQTALPSFVPNSSSQVPIHSNDAKMEQFKQILGRIVSDAIQTNETHLTHHITESVSKEMDYMFRQKEEADEARYRTLDETIRNFQKARQEAAAAEINASKMSKKRHKKGIFSAKK